MTGLPLLTFEDLVGLADERRKSARAPDKIAGWVRLLGVARSLAGTGGAADDPVVGLQWWLTRIRVAGYQGVGTTRIDIALEPTPGITVLHGPNGAGKSDTRIGAGAAAGRMSTTPAVDTSAFAVTSGCSNVARLGRPHLVDRGARLG